jgi:organic radical activating enzyme
VKNGSIKKDVKSLNSQPIEKVLGFCNWLNEQKKQGKKITLVLTGGEPTTYKHLPDIIEVLDPEIYTVLISNGSRSVQWWQNLKRIPDNVILSTHNETDIGKIVALGEFLLARECDVRFNCSMDAEDWDASVKRYEIIRDKFGNRANRKVINALDANGKRKDPQSYTESQRNYLTTQDSTHDTTPEITKLHVAKWKSKTFDKISLINESDEKEEFNRIYARNWIIRNDLNHFTGWKCHAGQETICVVPSGIVYAGICGIKLIGDLSNVQLLTEPVICTKSTCIAPGDVVITKYKQ